MITRWICAALSLAALCLLLLGGRASAQDAPIALEKWGRYHVNITSYMPNVAPGAKVKWVPKVQLVFKVTAPETDDVVQLQHYQGSKKWGPVQTCQITSGGIVKRLGRGGTPMGYSLVVPTCLMDEKLAISKAGTFAVEVSYKQTGAGKLHSKLGRYGYQVKTYNAIWPGKKGPTKGYTVDHDFRLGEAWAYLNSEGQLQLWTWFKYDRPGEQLVRGARMRCFVGDKKLPFYDNPTARTTNDYDNYPTRDKNEKTTWGLFYWWAARADGVLAGDWLKQNPGSYRCTLTQAGDIAREFFFEVADGAIKPAPCQGQSGDQVKTVPDEVLIKMTFKKNRDLKFNKSAFSKSGLYGRKWPAGCPL